MTPIQVLDAEPAAELDPELSCEETNGWQPDPSERRDFFHRVRVFPAEVATWRKRLVKEVIRRPDRFPAIPEGAPEAEVRSMVDEGVSLIREVSRILAVLHGTPRLGNQEDPVDELVYIILSRKTRESAYQATFHALKRRFASWDELLEAPRAEVLELIRSGGLSERKADSLFGALGRLRELFGTCTMEPVREVSDDELEVFLCSLPEISRKSAYCIMMYAFGRKVLPVDTHVGRILSRVGIYKELGLDLSGLDHKKLQSELADLIPPNLRYPMHVNLIAHGREICRAESPRCDECEISRFCTTFRRDAAASRPAGPSLIDLFCGAGGSSLGFRRAGYRVILALDSDPVAMKTYRLNHPDIPDDRAVCDDVRDVDWGAWARQLGESVDVLIGSPPCQGFSHVGNRSKKADYRLDGDHRNFLFREMVRAAIALRPKLFLMENVPGMQSARKQNLSFLELAARELEGAGFMTTIWKLNACAFGVPQDRIRYFLVASTTGSLPQMPQGEYKDILGANYDVDGLDPIGVMEAIFDLPERDANSGTPVELADCLTDRANPSFRRYLSKFDIRGSGKLLFNHTVRYHNENDLELYALLRQGEDSVHAIETHGREDLMRYRKDVFDDKYSKLRADRPSKTIVAHLAKDGNGYIHPVQVRSISLREAARLQSFPDGYAFCGAPSDQWVQVGNAVPPLLARAIARSFLPLIPREDAR